MMTVTYPDAGPGEGGGRDRQGDRRATKPRSGPSRPAPPHAPADAPKSQVHRRAASPSSAAASGKRLTLRWRASDVTAPVLPRVGAPGLAPPTQAQVSVLVNTAPARFPTSANFSLILSLPYTI